MRHASWNIDMFLLAENFCGGYFSWQILGLAVRLPSPCFNWKLFPNCCQLKGFRICFSWKTHFFVFNWKLYNVILSIDIFCDGNYCFAIGCVTFQLKDFQTLILVDTLLCFQLKAIQCNPFSWHTLWWQLLFCHWLCHFSTGRFSNILVSVNT